MRIWYKKCQLGNHALASLSFCLCSSWMDVRHWPSIILNSNWAIAGTSRPWTASRRSTTPPSSSPCRWTSWTTSWGGRQRRPKWSHWGFNKRKKDDLISVFPPKKRVCSKENQLSECEKQERRNQKPYFFFRMCDRSIKTRRQQKKCGKTRNLSRFLAKLKECKAGRRLLNHSKRTKLY